MLKIIIKITSLLAALFIAVSCEESDSRYANAIISKALSLMNDKLSQFDHIIVIPGSGCTGCISKAEQYFNENVNNDNILFIFTNYYSFKNMTLRLGGLNNLTRNNVYCDAENTFYMHEYNERIYPYIISIDNAKFLTARPL